MHCVGSKNNYLDKNEAASLVKKRREHPHDAQSISVQKTMEDSQEEDDNPIYLDPAIYSQESESDTWTNQKTPLYSIGNEIEEYLDTPFQATT